MAFMLSYSSLSATLCNGVSIGEYKAYWHIKFSLINGVASVNIINLKWQW